MTDAIVKAKTAIEKSAEVIENIEDELYREGCEILAANMSFADLEPPKMAFGDEEASPPGPPPEWVERYGQKKAEKRYRLAAAGWLSDSDAPSGIKTARHLVIGIMKIRANRPSLPRGMNLTFVQMSTSHPEYQELEVDE